MNGDTTERLSQESQCPKDGFNGLLARASAFAGGVLSSIQALAGTTACKGVQIARLKDWAKENDCWFENPESLGVFSDRGSENEVYMAYDGIHVYKLNDFRYSDDNLTPFFERIPAHNQYFPDCAYDFIGFSQNRDGKVCAVLRQQLVVNAREATPEEIKAEFERIGFTQKTMENISPMAFTTSSMPYQTMYWLAMMATTTSLTQLSSNLIRMD